MGDRRKQKEVLGRVGSDGKPPTYVGLRPIRHFYRLVWSDDPAVLLPRLQALYRWIIVTCSEGSEPFRADNGEQKPITCFPTISPGYLIISVVGLYKQRPIDMSFLMERCSLYIKAYAHFGIDLDPSGMPVNDNYADPDVWLAVSSGIYLTEKYADTKRAWFTESYVKGTGTQEKGWEPTVGYHEFGKQMERFHDQTRKEMHQTAFHCAVYNLVEPVRIQSVYVDVVLAFRHGRDIKLKGNAIHEVKNWDSVSKMIQDGKGVDLFNKLRILKRESSESGESSEAEERRRRRRQR